VQRDRHRTRRALVAAWAMAREPREAAVFSGVCYVIRGCPHAC
jgi:hypothetical protein